MEKYWAIAVLMLLVIGLSACNTISGAGQDVQAIGDAVEEVAEDTKDELKDND